MLGRSSGGPFESWIIVGRRMTPKDDPRTSFKKPVLNPLIIDRKGKLGGETGMGCSIRGGCNNLPALIISLEAQDCDCCDNYQWCSTKSISVRPFHNLIPSPRGKHEWGDTHCDRRENSSHPIPGPISSFRFGGRKNPGFLK
jgi:hypothetical protein